MSAAPKEATVKPEVLARTKWHHNSATMVRPCIKCREDFPSTSPADRICPDCLQSIAAARARAAITDDDDPRTIAEDYFDTQPLEMRMLAREYDRLNRAGRQHAIMVARGLGDTPEALRLAELARQRDEIYRKPEHNG